MMHNSVWIRELLHEANNDQLHKTRRHPHLDIDFKDPLPCGDGEFELEGTWRIEHDGSTGMNELSEDLCNFLVKMGVDVSEYGNRTISLTVCEDERKGEFSLAISRTSIDITGSDVMGMWAGAVRLEREMSSRRGPILPMGDISGRPSWGTQISQSPWGSNYLVPDLSQEFLSDDAFRLLVHYGVNGMTIYGDILFYVNSEILPELNYPSHEQNLAALREATERAARYGITLYWVPVLPKLAEDNPVFVNHPEVRGSRLGTPPGKKRIFTLCSSQEKSLQFYSEFWMGIFDKVPLLGGIIMIIGGESYYHCYMRPAGEDLDDPKGTNCPHCGKIPAEQVVARFTGNSACAIHRVKPDAVALAWPYSAFRWSKDFEQIGLIELLPSDVGLHSEIDKDHFMKKEGYTKRIWDYSVDFTGPSDRIIAQREACRSRGLGFFVKTETALGLEAIHMPYVPCLNRLGEKWRNVADLEPDGVLQAWMFFGMFGSRAEELGWWARWRPEVTFEDVLATIAFRDFGPAADACLEAWKLMSGSVSHLPCIPPYFNGPWFLGPAHPLLFEGEVPEEFTGALYFLQENEESLSKARLDTMDSLVLESIPESPRKWSFTNESGGDDWDAFMREVENSLRLSGEAFESISAALEMGLSDGDTRRLGEESLHVEFFYRTMRSVRNALKFHLAISEEEKNRYVRDELENAIAAAHIYREAPWLDLSLRRDAGFPSSTRMLQTKIEVLEKHLGGQ